MVATRHSGHRNRLFLAVSMSVWGLLPILSALSAEENARKVMVEHYRLYTHVADLAISGIIYDATDGLYWANSDRGPRRSEATFFQPRLYRLMQMEGFFVVTQVIPLLNEDGSPATGVPDDPRRIDPEDITVAPDGTLWMVDEYGPYILHASRNGRIMERIAAPSLFTERLPNQGFEGVALSPDGRTLYAALQHAPQGEINPNRTYIAVYDLSAKTFSTYVYDHTDPKSLDYAKGVNAAIGISGLAMVDERTLLVLERDNQAGEKARVKRIYSIDIKQSDSGTPLRKTLYADLYALGYRLEKPEGIALPNAKTVVVVNDDDAVPGSPTEVWLIRAEEPSSSPLVPQEYFCSRAEEGGCYENDMGSHPVG